MLIFVYFSYRENKTGSPFFKGRENRKGPVIYNQCISNFYLSTKFYISNHPYTEKYYLFSQPFNTRMMEEVDGRNKTAVFR